MTGDGRAAGGSGSTARSITTRLVGVLGLVAALALSGCASDWQERYEQSQKESLDLVQQMEDLRTQQAQESARAEANGAQVAAMDRENKNLLDERNAAAEAARAWQAKYEAASASGTSAPASPQGQGTAESKASELRRQGIDANSTADGNVEIRLSSDVTFASGSDVLSESGKKVLRSLAPRLNGDFAPYSIRVEGHTDNQPVVKTKAKFGDNLGLSTARANAVTRFMREDMRIDSQRLVSAGRGEQMPIADNKSDAGRARNRRVEIVVVMGVQAK